MTCGMRRFLAGCAKIVGLSSEIRRRAAAEAGREGRRKQ
ncbi:hypothetical protein Esi_0194_0031 [Ectocarpus siliculosus]|uniref:Uncharacterized protein n=1 Tax=Ectocarpus siliculosus TaxID=2880 RepID=D7FPN1_ECTSI|nr:hypothetical protein Esi_0194_0031 [Ectocarpus siliculosus]|eukprot:CBJ30488.1 hypothetical protein Esi_0194_0031 [Ectocarpus siliculosus]